MNESPTVHRAGPTPVRFNDLRLCESLQAALKLRFNLRAGRFSFTAPEQAGSVEISEAALAVLISTSLAQQPELFPSGQIRPRRLRRIVNLLRAVCADAGVDVHQSLRQFVETRLMLEPGADITSAEIRAAYEVEAELLGEPVLSRYEFHRHLPGLIRQQFGLLKLHEIERPCQDGRLTKRNGWRGLALTDATDSTDSTDSTLISLSEQTQPA